MHRAAVKDSGVLGSGSLAFSLHFLSELKTWSLLGLWHREQWSSLSVSVYAEVFLERLHSCGLAMVLGGTHAPRPPPPTRPFFFTAS